MSITDKINSDLKIAMKEKNTTKLTALRAVKSAFLLEKTSGNKDSKMSEEKGLKIIQKLIKQRRDSAEIYKQQERNDLFEKEMSEISFLEVYLPKQLSEPELIDIIKDAIQSIGASSMKDMGKVIGIVNKKVGGRAEGKIIAQKVKELLG